jgi:outer membrane receptor protein involved in Fe transport
LRAESLYNYETGFRVSTGRLYARAHFFDAELYDPIVRRTLLFPAAGAPASLAGLPVTMIPPTAAQRAQGVVTVATALDPRAVKAFVNDGRARYYGSESLIQFAFAPRWSARAAYAFLAGRELLPDRNVRRLPPQSGRASVRYGRAFWLEPGIAFAGAQKRLSGGDIDDERIGASRRRSDIADFFRGSRVAGLLDASGRFIPTGETLAEIQNRVLPGVDDAVRVPLYRSTAGWATLEVRGGAPLGERLELQFSVANLADKNYRIHGSGIDAPGIDAYVALRYGW